MDLIAHETENENQSRFLKLSQDYSSLMVNAGVDVIPYYVSSLDHFSNLSSSLQKQMLKNFGGVVDLLRQNLLQKVPLNESEKKNYFQLFSKNESSTGS